MFHCLIFTGSPSVFIKVGFSDEGMDSFLQVSIHVAIWRMRKVEVNGPK